MGEAFIRQINISKGGIPKRPIAEAVVTELGIEGDDHAHPQYHGGIRKALLLVSEEGIAELVEAGFPLYAGAMGENVTTTGLDRREWRAGQRYKIGPITVQLTTMRQPCRTLSPYGRGIQKAVYDADVEDGIPESPRWGLSGFYARVLEPGIIRPGDPITLLP